MQLLPRENLTACKSKKLPFLPFDMRQQLKTGALFVLIFVSLQLQAQVWNESQEVHGSEYPGEPGPESPCISAEQYEALEKTLKENYRLLGLDQKAISAMTTKFAWPLRQANGLNDCSYFTLRNFVDQDTTPDSIRDWNCGKQTYDGHKGVDITPYPYWFYKMDNNQVEVVAAAPGTIVAKADGNFDRNCLGFNGPLLPANYIVIRHQDGSTARYFHLKMNSVTSKAVGQTVVSGEYLGVVGSSGISTNPHLHFEVLKTSSTSQYVDPFGGTCNASNDSSLWINQLPYIDPGILKVSVNTISPVLPECPETETPNEDSCFLGGESAKFYIFVRNQRAGTSAAMRILRSDGSVFNSWTKNFTDTYSRSYWGWTRTLPTETGSYMFEAAYDGEVCSKPFKINCLLTDTRKKEQMPGTLFFPNPISTRSAIQFEPALNGATLLICNSQGIVVQRLTSFTGSSLPLQNMHLQPGVHCIQISDGVSGTFPVKLILTD
jgi:murein DD-endopeptidase MepM/ murein hydrolase activator NlpD